MIAFDRYAATNYPIRYHSHRRSISRVLIHIFIGWFVSIVICLLPALFFNNQSQQVTSAVDNRTVSISTNKYDASTRQCELYKDMKFVVTSSFLSFYLPLIIMIFLYGKVFVAIRQQSLKSNKNSVSLRLYRERNSSSNITSEQNSIRQWSSRNRPFGRRQTSGELSFSDQHSLKRRDITAEVRITRSLAVVIACFIVCWLPFFTLYIIRSICLCLSFDAIEFFVWLGYSNSAINPLLYAILNRNFRLAFKNLFLSLKRICF